MKLFYFTRPDKVENFGDSLNPWLWGKLLTQELDEDPTTAFVGIGTILNGDLGSKLPQAKNLVIFSSGFGYGAVKFPTVTDRWTIYCVRGPLSAAKMGVPDDRAVADGAMLLRRVFQATEPKDIEFSFMPHVEQAMLGDELFRDACQEVGIRYIDPRWPIEQILSLISRTEVLLAEAMHGAIAAEAIRVPWVPVVSSSRILPFKWMDWCASLGLEYQPSEIMPLVSCYPLQRDRQNFNQNWLDDLKQTESSDPQKIRIGQVQLMAEQLRQISNTAQPQLSSDRIVEDLTVKLEERLDQFKSDVKAGKFRDSTA
jgi:succinoglycan biosynthesis protein ExoV